MHPRVVRVKLRNAEPVRPRIASDLAHRHEPVIAIEGCVLYALRHNRRRELLEAHQKLRFLSPLHFHCQNGTYEVEQASINILPVLLGTLCGVVNEFPVFIRDLSAGRLNVAAIDVEARCNLANGAPHLGPRVVTLIAVGLAYLHEETGQPVHITAQRFLSYVDLLFVRNRIKVRRLSCKVLVNVIELLHALRPDQHAERSIEKVVSACPLDRPALTQKLARLQNLLRDHPRIRRMLTQSAEVLQWIAQSIRMIDSYSIQHAAMQPVQDQRVRLLEDVLSLHAQSNQRVHIEESPVPKLLVGSLPIREPIVLLIKEVIESVLVVIQVRD